MKEMSPEDIKRIEAAAKAHSDKYTTSEQYNEGMFDGYVDGAEAEHERMAELLNEERIRVINEIKNIIVSERNDNWNWYDLLKELESLKSQ